MSGRHYRVTHVAVTVREMGTSYVSEIGGIGEDGRPWRVSADVPLPPESSYFVLAGSHHVPVEHHENRERGYSYFVAPGSEERVDLLHGLAPLDH